MQVFKQVKADIFGLNLQFCVSIQYPENKDIQLFLAVWKSLWSKQYDQDQ